MLTPDFPIRTERLLLRPFADTDLDALHAIQSRPDVARYLYWAARNRDEVREALALRVASTAVRAGGETLSLAIVLPGENGGTLIGDSNLTWRSEEHQQGEIGYVLHPDHHGRGYAGEVAATLLRLGFDGLGLHRIEGRCDARNTASARVLEKIGMRREAHYRQNELVKGEWTDEYVYAVLRTEWESVHGERTAG